MEQDSRAYCKIYVNGPGSLTELCDHIVKAIGGRDLRRHDIESPNCDIVFWRNDEFDENRAKDPDPLDGFLYYRFYLDVDPLPGATRRTYEEEIATLLRSFWDRKWKAVAACNFEDRLPRKGGRESPQSQQ